MDASIHSLEDAVAVAQEVRSFCRERNIDEKRAYYSALVVEELSLGIIKERFGVSIAPTELEREEMNTVNKVIARVRERL